MTLPLSAADLALLFPFSSSRGDTATRAAFRFTRFLRHNRRLLLKYEETSIRRLCAEWSTHAAAYFKDPLAAEPDDTFELVAEAWNRAAFPLGANPLADAAQHAAADTLDYPSPAKYGPVHALVYRAVCFLNTEAVRNSATEFFVSSHALAKSLRQRQALVYRALRRMENDGILNVKARGTAHRATRYHVFLPPSKV